MQNKVEIKDNQLIIIPQGINKLTSLKKRLEIPLQHVQGASIDMEILDESAGFRGPGTKLNNYWAGTFRKDGEKTFFNIKSADHKPVVVVQLANENYTRLVLGVDNPEEIVDLVNNSIN